MATDNTVLVQQMTDALRLCLTEVEKEDARTSPDQPNNKATVAARAAIAAAHRAGAK
jgi:hypothetical protein